MIPDFVDIGGPWKVLPSGIHGATMNEIECKFAFNKKRTQLFSGFSIAIRNLWNAGCVEVYLDGSFVTDKNFPGDFDSCWNPVGVNVNLLDVVFLDFTNKRAAQKLKFGGEFFPSSSLADGSKTFLQYFQVDKYTGKNKGIIHVVHS